MQPSNSDFTHVNITKLINKYSLISTTYFLHRVVWICFCDNAIYRWRQIFDY